MYKKITFLMLLSFSFIVSANNKDGVSKSIQAQSKLLINNQQKIAEMQQEIDLLRGKIDEITYKLAQSDDRQSAILKKIDELTVNNKIDITQNLNTLKDWNPSGDDRKDYNFIIKFVLDNREVKESTIAFEKFLSVYTKSSYLPNVNYWVGQLCYIQGRKDDAAYYFAKVAREYPTSSKASESLYKIALIILDKGEKNKAKTLFEKIIKEYNQDKAIFDMALNKINELN